MVGFVACLLAAAAAAVVEVCIRARTLSAVDDELVATQLAPSSPWRLRACIGEYKRKVFTSTVPRSPGASISPAGTYIQPDSLYLWVHIIALELLETHFACQWQVQSGIASERNK